MAETFTCTRCSRSDVERLPQAPMPGPIGEEVQAKVCTECWEEWQRAEVMVINELRLNFMDPTAQETLDGHMREFFFLDGGGGDGEAAGFPPGYVPPED